MNTEHFHYLMKVSTGENAPITRKTAMDSLAACWMIWATSGGVIPAPAACTGPDGKMFYSWDKGRHHLELEIIPDEPAEFFYRDRETEEIWGEDYRIGDPLPTGVVSRLAFFI